jgi:hypothetical protein
VDDQVKLVNQIGFDQGADELPSGVHDSGYIHMLAFRFMLS